MAALLLGAPRHIVVRAGVLSQSDPARLGSKVPTGGEGVLGARLHYAEAATLLPQHGDCGAIEGGSGEAPAAEASSHGEVREVGGLPVGVQHQVYPQSSSEGPVELLLNRLFSDQWYEIVIYKIRRKVKIDICS